MSSNKTALKNATGRVELRSHAQLRSQTADADAGVSAVKRLQAAVRRRRSQRLSRDYLAERLSVELNLCRGLRLMALITGMLVAILGMWSTLANPKERLHLRRFLVEKFALDELEEIRTLDALQSYLKDVSAQSRTLMPRSSIHFNEGESAVIFVTGIRAYPEPLVIPPGQEARVDSRTFTLTAWVETLSARGRGAYVIRKPLGGSREEFPLSWCVARHPRRPPRVLLLTPRGCVAAGAGTSTRSPS